MSFNKRNSLEERDRNRCGMPDRAMLSADELKEVVGGAWPRFPFEPPQSTDTGNSLIGRAEL